MYDELVKALRICEDGEHCDLCPKWDDKQNGGMNVCQTAICKEAADAIETMCEMVATAHGEIANVIQSYEESKLLWIPVTERLPETGVDVLVMFPHNMAVASRDMGEWVVNSGDGWCTDVNLSDDEKEPTHWMPLPKPPKEE